MNLPTPYYDHDGITLYCCDCRDILPEFPDKSFDAVVTDPPWGLGVLSGTTSKERNKNAYADHWDSEEYVSNVVVPCIRKSLSISDGRGLVACGVRCMFMYDRPRAVGGFYQPAAVGMSPWGFAGFNPVLFYGKDPRDGKGQSNIMTVLTERASTNEHPCAKPIGAMLWMANKATLESESILDPFCGSGTTLVAAKQLGRKAVGIELSEKYCEIAVKRLAQMELFR